MGQFGKREIVYNFSNYQNKILKQGSAFYFFQSINLLSWAGNSLVNVFNWFNISCTAALLILCRGRMDVAQPEQRSASLEEERQFVVFDLSHIFLKNWPDSVYIAEGESQQFYRISLRSLALRKWCFLIVMNISV